MEGEEEGEDEGGIKHEKSNSHIASRITIPFSMITWKNLMEPSSASDMSFFNFWEAEHMCG